MISVLSSSLVIELELMCCETDRFDDSKLNDEFDSDKFEDRFKYDKNDIENE